MATIQSNPSPIELADAAQRRLFVLSLIFGVFAALIAALLAFFVWRANNKYQEAVKADADARIATADSRAAQANAEAAKLNREAIRIESEGKERVARLEAEATKRIAELDSEAERAKRERAEADKQIAVAKASAAAAAQQTAEVSLRLEEEGRKRAEAEIALEELRRRQEPRILPLAFTSTLKENLKYPFNVIWGPVTILYQRDDLEAFAFASQIRSALLSTNAQVSDSVFAAPSTLDIRNPGVDTHVPVLKLLGAGPGITIVSASGGKIEGTPEFVLGQAFKVCGFDVHSAGPSFGMPHPQGITIIVGPKP